MTDLTRREDTRSDAQANADDRIREEVERTGGIWAQMTPEQRAQILGRLRDKKARALAARARKQAEQETIEERVAKLEERIARLGGQAGRVSNTTQGELQLRAGRRASTYCSSRSAPST